MEIDTTLSGHPDVRASARRAADTGYDGLWTAEVQNDPFIALTLAATVTERPKLGTSVALALARNPMSLASTAHGLQALTGGRLLLGLGTQVRAHITRRYSMPWSRPAARMREFVLAMRSIWDCWADGGPLDFRGEFYTHTLMPPTFIPEPHGLGAPKVLLAGVGTAMTAVAGEVADGFLSHGFTTERYLREVTLPALRNGPRGASADFQVVGMPMLAVGDTDDELQRALEKVRSQVAFYGSTPAYRAVLGLHGWDDLGERLHRLSQQGEWDRMTALVDDEVLRTFAVVGRPAEVAEELMRRFGDVFTRCSVHTTYPVAPELLDEIAAAVRSQGARAEEPA
jgi:probable F420-dependent oxidoreductase